MTQIQYNSHTVAVVLFGSFEVGAIFEVPGQLSGPVVATMLDNKVGPTGRSQEFGRRIRS